MNLRDFIPSDVLVDLDQVLLADLDRVVAECKAKYFYFNPDDQLHMMFAMQVLLLREVSKVKAEQRDARVREERKAGVVSLLK